MKEFTGYLASHFFNAAMYEWTEKLAVAIEENTDLKIYVPHRNASINDKKNNDDIITDIAISKADTLELKRANILIANLDGLTIDDGVAAEIMAHGVISEIEEEYNINTDFPRMIIGVLTDMRYQGTGDNHLYRNLMIIGKVKEHGHLVVGYPGDDNYIDQIINLINDFINKNK